ncbi:MAG: hypothetical protein ABJE66_17525 [Deltaproteobacteria bacterium]
MRFGMAAAGVEVDDPHGVLYGSSDGKHVRFVNAAQIDSPRIASWLRTVIATRNK